MEYQPVSQEEETEVVAMGEKEEVISMTDVMVDVEGAKTPSSPLLERFDLEKQFHMNQASGDEALAVVVCSVAVSDSAGWHGGLSGGGYTPALATQPTYRTN